MKIKDVQIGGTYTIKVGTRKQKCTVIGTNHGTVKRKFDVTWEFNGKHFRGIRSAAQLH